MEPIQIELFKVLGGIILTVGLFTSVGLILKFIVDRIPTKILEKVL